MKKIIVDKEEGVAEIIDQILQEKDAEITLVIPKGSVLGRSVSNFHLLKREMDAADRAVFVESVDESILAFSKASGIESNHPLWRGGVRGASLGMSDIVPADEAEADGKKKAGAKRGKKKSEPPPVKLSVPSETEEETAEEKPLPMAIQSHAEEEEVSSMEKLHDEATPEQRGEGFFTGKFFTKRDRIDGVSGFGGGGGSGNATANVDDDEEAPMFEERGGSRKWLWIAGGVVVFFLLVGWVVTAMFGRATVAINFKKTQWTHGDAFAADKSVATSSAATNVIPAQVFTANKNTTQTFPASGNANVSLKAKGTLTVVNSYSSAAQDLVASTRFVTPDGKIFRLVNNITVPGAKVTNGQIVPSSIDVPVTADQAGPAYNVGAVQKLTIPGFQGTPKYNAFYGELAKGASGGFTGSRAVPTAADIANAKTKTTGILQSSLSSDFTTSYPNNFKILPGATTVAVTQLTVSTSTDDQGNFTVFGTATLQAIGFDEAAFKNFLLSIAESAGTDQNKLAFKNLTITYTNVKPDFAKGKVSFSVAADGTIEPAFSADDFKAHIEGKSINEARIAIAALPDLSDGKISVWPMWLWSIPANPAKIQLSTD